MTVYSTKIRMKIVTYEKPSLDPFHLMGVREMSRLTGHDQGYLSRVKNGKLSISPKTLVDIYSQVEAEITRQHKEAQLTDHQRSKQ